MDNINHVAMAWIRDHVRNTDYCKQLLEGSSNSWKYVIADLVGKCRCEIILGEEYIQDVDVHSIACCDVCSNPQLVGMTEELRIIVQWICVWFFFTVDISIIYDKK